MIISHASSRSFSFQGSGRAESEMRPGKNPSYFHSWWELPGKAATQKPCPNQEKDPIHLQRIFPRNLPAYLKMPMESEFMLESSLDGSLAYATLEFSIGCFPFSWCVNHHN